MMIVMLVKLLNEVDVISEVVVVISLSVVGGLEVILVLVNVISGIVVNGDVVYV